MRPVVQGGAKELEAATWLAGPYGLNGHPQALQQAALFVKSTQASFAAYHADYKRLLATLGPGMPVPLPDAAAAGGAGAAVGAGVDAGAAVGVDGATLLTPAGALLVRPVAAADTIVPLASTPSATWPPAVPAAGAPTGDLLSWLQQRGLGDVHTAVAATGAVSPSDLLVRLEQGQRGVPGVKPPRAAALWAAVEEQAKVSWRITWQMAQSQLLATMGSRGQAVVDTVRIASFLTQAPVLLKLVPLYVS